MTDVQVTLNEDEKRYEARVDGELAGSAYFDAADDLIVFTHTEVDDAYEGHGVGSALARAALDDVRATDVARWSPGARSSRAGSTGTRTTATCSSSRSASSTGLCTGGGRAVHAERADHHRPSTDLRCPWG